MEKQKELKLCPYCDGQTRQVRVHATWSNRFYEYLWQCYKCLKYASLEQIMLEEKAIKENQAN